MSAAPSFDVFNSSLGFGFQYSDSFPSFVTYQVSKEYFIKEFLTGVFTIYSTTVPSSASTVIVTSFERSIALPLSTDVVALSETVNVGTTVFNTFASASTAASSTLNVIVLSSLITGCSITMEFALLDISKEKAVILASLLSEPVRRVPSYTTLTFCSKLPTVASISISTFTAPFEAVPLALIIQDKVSTFKSWVPENV